MREARGAVHRSSTAHDGRVKRCSPRFPSLTSRTLARRSRQRGARGAMCTTRPNAVTGCKPSSGCGAEPVRSRPRSCGTASTAKTSCGPSDAARRGFQPHGNGGLRAGGSTPPRACPPGTGRPLPRALGCRSPRAACPDAERRMRGKRRAKPLAWRSLRMMLLKATSSTTSGSTVRKWP